MTTRMTTSSSDSHAGTPTARGASSGCWRGECLSQSMGRSAGLCWLPKVAGLTAPVFLWPTGQVFGYLPTVFISFSNHAVLNFLLHFSYSAWEADTLFLHIFRRSKLDRLDAERHRTNA